MIKKVYWNPPSVAWMAGIMEGEGSFLADSDRRYKTEPIRLSVKCDMTDEDVIMKLALTAGFGTVNTSKRGENKRIWRWCGQGTQDVIDFEAMLFPYLGERRRKQILLTHDLRRNYELANPGPNIRRAFTTASGELLSYPAVFRL